jgi:hypothetical protein
MEDSRIEIAESLPQGVEIVTQVDASLSEGRAARAMREVER